MYNVNKWFYDIIILINCCKMELFMINLVYDEIELKFYSVILLYAFFGKSLFLLDCFIVIHLLSFMPCYYMLNPPRSNHLVKNLLVVN